MLSMQPHWLACFLQFTTSLAFTGVNHETNPYEVTVYNELAYQRYNITIALGKPPQTFPLLLDTGSSDIWVPLSNSSGCAPSCPAGLGFNATLSTTLIDLNTTFEARYGLTPDLIVLGKYYNDSMVVGDLLPLPNAQFAVGDIPLLFFRQGNRGIFGLGSRVQQSVFRGNLSNTYTPVWERLAIAASGERKFAVWLNGQNASTGTVQFGGEDKGKYSGRLQRTNVNLDSSGQRFGWEVNVTSVTRVLPGGGKVKETKKVLTPSNYSLEYTIDTGSPNMYVPATLYQAIVEGLNVTERINEASYVPCSLRSPASGFLDFGFPKADSDEQQRKKEGENFTIRVPLNDIIYPYGYPVTWPLVPDRNGEKMCYFGIVPNEFPRILGATFIRSAYMVFDGDRQEVSMAQAKWDV